ncbi:MAG: hypothetical protein NTU54_08715 [Candidatus Omnitrophica bacterium]|nr:hypothetical protein [Candidatus Omnitrophota bacterium]
MKSAGFNPKARWDLHIPAQEAPHPRNSSPRGEHWPKSYLGQVPYLRGVPEADPDSLNAKIEVFALFKAGKIYPQSFNWNNKTYQVQRVTYNWQERCGNQVINYFTLACGNDLYQVSFNNTSLGWSLNKIIT